MQISSSGATPIAGQSYTLTCSVSEATVTTYQWRKDSIMLSETGQTLSFSPLRLSDAGQYICEITVDGVMHNDEEDVVIESNTE